MILLVGTLKLTNMEIAQLLQGRLKEYEKPKRGTPETDLILDIWKLAAEQNPKASKKLFFTLLNDGAYDYENLRYILSMSRDKLNLWKREGKGHSIEAWVKWLRSTD